MTTDELNKANEINDQLNCISNMKSILSYPYPVFIHEHEVFNTILLGDDTVRELKKVINDFLDAKSKALTEEFNKL